MNEKKVASVLGPSGEIVRPAGLREMLQTRVNGILDVMSTPNGRAMIDECDHSRMLFMNIARVLQDPKIESDPAQLRELVKLVYP